ncbi:MAG: oxygen-insensitive NADPH nitroreductase [Cardiobacteriaceae bacterium]|nr:oxygen-insensitive NADPH nitroreductase [Cardiobacteriaceae bacterium]
MSNPTVDLILNHHSVRHYASRKIEPEIISTLVKCAQAAATSHYVQPYSIVSVTDREIQNQLAELAGQKHIPNAAHIFVFVADFNRHNSFINASGDIFANAENLLVAAIDSALAAQNLTLAAESYGIGCCYLGSLRNDCRKVAELLNLPKLTFPLFGIACGYPEGDRATKKPRLPEKEVHYENRYDTSHRAENLAEYDQEIKEYYESRNSRQRIESWTGMMRDFLNKEARKEIGEILREQKMLD